MALSNYTYFEVRTTGSDTTNSGGFDINSSGFFTDGSITSANTASPVISSASYTFVAGDVGACVFIKSGTNSISGWYRIVSVNAGAATLNGAIGGAVTVDVSPSTVLGCGTAASLSSITFGVDYSQQDTYRYTGNFVVQATTSNIVGSGITINRSWVGNLINLTGVGSGLAISGYYNIASVGGTVATLDRSAGTAGSASTGYAGGALYSPGMAAGLCALGNRTYIKTGTYGIGTTIANVSGGRIQTVGGSTGNGSYGLQVFEGYNLLRGDKLFSPTIQMGIGITNTNIITLVSANHRFENLIIDGNNQLSVYGIRDTANPSVENYVYRCKIMNCTAQGYYQLPSHRGHVNLCEFTGNSGASIGIYAGSRLTYCTFHDNTFTPVFIFYGALMSNCIVANNSGASTDGVNTSDNSAGVTNCTIYNNGRDGIRFQGNSSQTSFSAMNNLLVNNGGYGINCHVQINHGFYEYNAFYNNALGNFGSNITGAKRNNITLSGNPFVDATNGNFALNSVAGAGLSVRASASPSPWLNYISTINSQDIGAVQNANSPVTYVNPERSITIKSGTTSRTEYIYLNTTGYTFSSTGLSASYVRAGSARVTVPLISQTVTGAYTSGGFCEIDATNMPGLYRLDVPNAIFNTGVKTAALEIINTTTNDRQLISYNFTQDMTIDLATIIPYTNTAQTVGDALNAARANGFGKWVISGTTLSIYAPNNTTVLKTFTLDSIITPTSRT